MERDRTLRKAISLFLGGLLAGIMCIAAMLKLRDVPAFADSLRAWVIFSNTAFRNTMALLVPCGELAIGLAWWLAPSRLRRFLSLAMAFALLLFAAGFAADAWSGGHPSCSCFGVILERANMNENVGLVLTRNGMLAGLGLASFFLSPVPESLGANSPPRLAAPPQALKDCPHGRGGFTLVELLIAILVLAILFGLTVVSLGNTRRGSKEALMLSRLGQHSRVFHAYATDYRDRSPYLSDPAKKVNIFSCQGDGTTVSGDYWSPAIYWHIAMGDGYYNGSSAGPVFHNPMMDPSVGGLFLYQPVLFSGADYWDPTKRVENDALQWTPCSLPEVLFPSEKAWIVTEYMGLAAGQGPYFSTGYWSGMTFIDGHSGRILDADQTPRYPQAELVPPFGNFGPLYTILGTRGRDVAR